MKTKKNDVKSTLKIHHIELIRLRIGYLNDCQYSVYLHYNELKNFGETDLRLLLVSVWNQVPNFSQKERSLFILTDYIISPNNKCSIQEVHNLLALHFNNEQIHDLTQAIKQIDLWTRSMKQFTSKKAS